MGQESDGLSGNSASDRDDWVAPEDGGVGQFNCGRISEDGISVGSWVAQLFSTSHLQGLNCSRRFFTSVPGAWAGMAAAARATGFLLSRHVASSHLAGLPDRMASQNSQTHVTLASPGQVMVGAVRLLGPSLRSSRTSLPPNSSGRAVIATAGSRAGTHTPPLWWGEKLWLSLVHTGVALVDFLRH